MVIPITTRYHTKGRSKISIFNFYHVRYWHPSTYHYYLHLFLGLLRLWLECVWCYFTSVTLSVSGMLPIGDK